MIGSNRGNEEQKIQAIFYFLESVFCHAVKVYVPNSVVRSFLVTPIAKLSCVRAFSVSPFASVRNGNAKSNR